jgi:hypothetical protein
LGEGHPDQYYTEPFRAAGRVIPATPHIWGADPRFGDPVPELKLTPARLGSCRGPRAARTPAELAGIENVTLIALADVQYRTVLFGSPWPFEVP